MTFTVNFSGEIPRASTVRRVAEVLRSEPGKAEREGRKLQGELLDHP